MTADGASSTGCSSRRSSGPSGAACAAFVIVSAMAASLWPTAARAEFTSTPVTSVRVGQPYRYDVVATGSGGVLITAPNGLPPWLTLTQTGSGTATLAGTPQSGDSGAGIRLQSEDTFCRIFQIFCYSYQTFDITIVENSVPTIVPPGLTEQNLTEGEPFTLDVAAAFDDPDGDTLSFSASGLPQSLALAGSVLSGTPTLADAEASPINVTITASDGHGGTVSQEFALVVAALARADVSLESVVPEPAPATRGDPVQWVVTVGNAGPDAAESVGVVVEFAGNAFTFDDHPCTLTVADDRQRLDCTTGPVSAGESAAVTITGSAAEAGDVYVTAAVDTGGLPIDPRSDNDAAAASLNVGQRIAADAAQSLTGSAAAGARAGDFDGDGFDDLAVATSGEDPSSVYMNLEDPAELHPALAEEGDRRRGLSAVPLSLDDAAGGRGVGIGDVDGDGDEDLLVAYGPDAASTVFVNDGGGVMTAASALGAADMDSRAVAVADLDGDGFADAAFANAGVDMVYLNRDGGTRFEEVPLGGAGDSLSARDVVAVDVVGDALPDLVFANLDGPATLHENLGGGTFGPAVAIDPGPASSVAAGDFNGDGYMDLVFGRAVTGPSGLPSNPVYLNDGSGNFVSSGELGASPTLDVLTGDFDEDGAADIVAINATGAHQVFLGDGNGGFSLHPSLFVSRGAAKAALGRIGLGGRVDVAVAGDDGVDVFFNDGAGAFGLGDTVRPVIELIGDEAITLHVDGTWSDPGATASDDLDGELQPTVDDPVDPKVIGTYTVTYTAVDSAGNAAVPVTRTVSVEARPASGGGGGGAAGVVLLTLLVAGGLGRNVRRRRRCSF